MTGLLDLILDTTGSISGWIWGLPMIVLLVGTGMLLTVRSGFVQIRNFPKAVRLLMKGPKGDKADGGSEGDISPFAALMTALSATVGNGNIAGVATAIAAGGPGAAFWMWVTAIFGMATKYAEAVLAIRFRERMSDGSMAGGPMYYCKHGIPGKLGIFLGGMFAVCGGIAALLSTGNMFQSQQIALAVNAEFGVPFWVTGAVLTVMVGAVILGGVKRIGATAERLVPLMIAFYFGSALLIILTHLPQVPAAIALIVKSAFNPQAAFGAAVGISIQHAMRFGIARGVLSNESGLGSAAIAHGAAKTRFPVAQGSIAMMGTFIDTIIVCTLTATAITVSGAYNQSMFLAGEGGLAGIDLTVEAFRTGMPGFTMGFGGTVVVFSSLIFGFTTLIGWSYYGQICWEYLFGLKIITPYRVVYLVLLFVGALLSGGYAPIVTNIGDICNAAMAFPNLVAMILLSGLVRQVTLESYRQNDLDVCEAKPIHTEHSPPRG